MLAPLALATAALLPLDDTCATATSGGSMGPNDVDILLLELSPGELTDHRRYAVEPGTLIIFQAQFSHATGDVQMVLWNDDCSQILGSSTSDVDVEEIRWTNSAASQTPVVVEVYLDNPQQLGVPYVLSVRGGFDGCGFADVFEPNQTCSSRAPLTSLGTYNVSPNDEDWFTVDVLPTSTLFIRTAQGVDPDVAIELWEPGCGAPIDDTPDLGGYVSARNGSAATIQVAVRVHHTDPMGTCTSYALQTGRVFGITECPSPLNSTGLDSVLQCSGGVELSLGDPVFQGFNFPSGATSLLAFGPDAATLPLGSGTLCIDPAGLRRGPLGQTIGLVHFFLMDAGTPAPGAPPILAGQTLRFQAWFVDAGHPSGFGLTNSVRVSFAPEQTVEELKNPQRSPSNAWLRCADARNSSLFVDLRALPVARWTAF